MKSIDENTKVTLTLGQLKRLVRESAHGWRDRETEATPEIVEVGDILYSTYLYDGVRHTFYKVLAKRGKSTIVVQRLRSNYVGSQTEDEATPGEPTNEEPLTLRFGKHGFMTSKYASSLNVWDGEPLHGYYDG